MIITALACSVAFSADHKTSEPNQLFYAANDHYEKGEYMPAVEGYMDIAEKGLENGNLYYNMGNAFLKLGKLGRAILCYEKAKRLIPHDSDLKANLAYARSLVESPDAGGSNVIINGINRIFAEYNLREIIFSATILYLAILIIIALSIFKPFVMQRFRIVLWLLIILLAVDLAGTGIRYFNEQVLRRGIVVQKEVQCKYEPIEKSTTYYTLREGADVIIEKTRDGWTQIRRPDGKIGWVKKEAVEEI